MRKVYDVTNYGAKPSNEDNKDAFLAAWSAACGSAAGNATLLIPNGTFVVGTVKFRGPCESGGAPAVVIDGVLQPPGGVSNDDAWITFAGVNNLLVTGAGTLDGQGGDGTDDDYCYQRKPITTTLKLEGVTNTVVRGLRLVNSRGFHVNFHRSSRHAGGGLHIQAPATSRNTDGVHVGLSDHVTISNTSVATGDDCVSLGPGSTDVVVSGVTCSPGHGISIGSLGKAAGEADVRGVVVKNCTVSATTNGLRVKTWPGSPPSRAYNITFQDIAMADVNNPIIVDQHYCPHGQCSDIAKISDVRYERISGTSSSREAVRLLCSESRPCSRVRLDQINLSCGQTPCGAQMSNVQGMHTSMGHAPSPSPSPAPAAIVHLEQEADDEESSTEQIRGVMLL
uniref:Exopolygalacturonase n=1 Tax=Oryza brachyantha TaxID=4533 RepID=J3MV02_ORYBR